MRRKTWLAAVSIAAGALVSAMSCVSPALASVPPGAVVHAVVGDPFGTPFPAAEGGPALKASIDYLWDVRGGPDGSIYEMSLGGVSGGPNDSLRRVLPDGTIHTIAGGNGLNGPRQPTCDGRLATQAGLGAFPFLAVGPDGTVYFTSVSDNAGTGWICKITPDGRIHTVAGRATVPRNGTEGDGGPAINANVPNPEHLAVGPDGTLYFAEGGYFGGNGHVRHIDSSGIVTTVAGNGPDGSPTGDLGGEPALRRALSQINGISFDQRGDLYITQRYSHTVERVTPDGILRRFAGNGKGGAITYGVPAVQATIGYPLNVVPAPDGTVYIATAQTGSTSEVQIFAVNPAGTVVPVAGQTSGRCPTVSDGELATQTCISEVQNDSPLFLTPDGRLVFGTGRYLIRAIESPPPPPVIGKAVDVKPVSGQVLIKLPPGAKLTVADGLAGAASAKGGGFVPLTAARQVPVGSELDTRAGVVSLVSASPAKGKTFSGTFGGAIFKVTQDRRGATKGLTTLTLLEGVVPGSPSYASCKKHRVADRSGPIAQTSAASLSTLHARGRGHFRTRGRYSAGTVRGTVWDTTDRCDGTLTVVHSGTVLVSDFVRHITLTVHAGHSYLARARR